MSSRLKIVAALGVCLGLYATSSAAADRVRVVNEGGIRDQWMLADGVNLAAPGYPADFAPRGDNVCMAVGYSIKPDGTTADFALLKAWTSSTGDKEPAPGFWDAFTQASAGALSQWKFKPRPEVSTPQATYTVATMNFMGKHATDVGELRGHCAIADLPTFVQQQQSNKFMAGRDKHDLDNLRRIQDQQRQAAASAASMRPGTSR